MNRFHLDGHVFRRLQNLEIAVVARSQPWRTERDAALAQGSVLGAGRSAEPLRGGGALLLLRLWRHGRQSPVGWLRNQRRSIIKLPLHCPDRAVVAGLAVGAFETRFISLDIREHAQENLVAERGV